MILTLLPHQNQEQRLPVAPQITAESDILVAQATADLERAAQRLRTLPDISRLTLGDLASVRDDLQLALLSLQIHAQITRQGGADV